MAAGKMSFVDLAGSERVKETKVEAQVFVESSNINKSLLTLGLCVAILADPKRRCVCVYVCVRAR